MAHVINGGGSNIHQCGRWSNFAIVLSEISIANALKSVFRIPNSVLSGCLAVLLSDHASPKHCMQEQRRVTGKRARSKRPVPPAPVGVASASKGAGGLISNLYSHRPSVYSLAVVVCLVFHVISATTLPLLITWDGHIYIRLADVIAGNASNWDFLRTPLYPVALETGFLLFGKGAMAVFVVQALFGIGGILLLGSIVRRSAGDIWAAGCIVLLAAYPTLLVYEHIVLSEPGTFFFLALIVWTLLTPVRNMYCKAALITSAITAGFYHRQSLLFLAVPAAVMFVLSTTDRSTGSSPAPVYLGRRSLPLWIAASIIAIVPYLLAYPWQRLPQVHQRINLVVAYGLVKQAFISPGDPAWGDGSAGYRDALAQSQIDGSLPLDGLKPGLENGPTSLLGVRVNDLDKLFIRLVITHPVQYGHKVINTLLFYAGIGGWGSDSASLANSVLAPTATATLIGEAPPGSPSLADVFAFPTADSLVRKALRASMPIYTLLVFLAVIAAPVALVFGIRSRDTELIVIAGSVISFLVINAAALNAQDRMAMPAWPVALVGFVLLTRLLYDRAPVWSLQSPWSTSRVTADIVFGGLVLALVAIHIVYAVSSRYTPSADEAHYTSGVYSIGSVLRTQGLTAAARAFGAALGYKAPFICVPAAVLMLFTNDAILASRLSMVIVFVGIAWISRRFFMHVLPPALACVAALLLMTTPLVTGLTHRVYTEGLVLFFTLLLMELLMTVTARPLWFAIACGLVSGLGLLTKTSFAALAAAMVACDAIWTHYETQADARKRSLTAIAFRVVVIAAVAGMVAASWYAKHWGEAIHHATTSLWCGGCAYPAPAAFISISSSATQLWVALLAMCALPFVAKAIIRKTVPPGSAKAWILLGATAVTTLVPYFTSGNQLVRFVATALPLVVALCTVAIGVIADKTRISALVITPFVGLSLIGTIHNSFGIPGLPRVALGYLRIFDYSFPLNGPDWFDDNHPLDRRDLRLATIEDFISRDRLSLNAQHPSATVGLTNETLSFNHDYFNLVGTMKRYPLQFWPFYIVKQWGLEKFDYLVVCSHCSGLNPGRRNLDATREILDSGTAGNTDFQRVFGLAEPDGAEVVVLRRIHSALL